jgi:hypothetical protein
MFIENWRRDYNEDRPKKDLGGVPPAVYAARLNSLANSGAKESSTVCSDVLQIKLLLKHGSRRVRSNFALQDRSTEVDESARQGCFCGRAGE